MTKKNKTRIVASTISICLIASGISLKCNRNKSEDISTKMNNYISTFESDDFEIAAHRGFSSLAVENTKDAINLASNQAYVDYIEVDARMTLDEKIVLSHNNSLKINPLTSIHIADINYDQAIKTDFHYRSTIIDKSLITKIDYSEKELISSRKGNLNNHSYQLVGLEEGLKACQDKKILLDLKFSNNVPEFVEELKKELKDINTDNIIFQSANLLGILYLQENTDFNCLAIMDQETDLQYISLFNRIGFKTSLVNHDIVKKILNEDKSVAIWTINNTEDLNKIVDELGSLYKDIIYITDYPDLIATELHEIEEKEKIKK